MSAPIPAHALTAAQRLELRRQFDADWDSCFYCGGRKFATPVTWFRHLRTAHPLTVRIGTLFDALGIRFPS